MIPWYYSAIMAVRIRRLFELGHVLTGKTAVFPCPDSLVTANSWDLHEVPILPFVIGATPVPVVLCTVACPSDPAGRSLQNRLLTVAPNRGTVW